MAVIGERSPTGFAAGYQPAWQNLKPRGERDHGRVKLLQCLRVAFELGPADFDLVRRFSHADHYVLQLARDK
jgi:hypothetical protein